MAFDSLGDFINAASDVGELQVIEGADLQSDVGCLTELIAERQGPMLVFNKFAGYPAGYRVCASALRSPRRLALAMGFPLDSHPVELVKLWKDKRAKLSSIAPAVVSDGPILECIQRDQNVDLTKFPAPLWHSSDGGRYIGTGDMVVLRDPQQGWINVGVYRGMVQGRDRLSLWITGAMKHGQIILDRYWERGQAAPVAIVLGCEPLTWMTASMSPPFGTSEYGLAGAYRGEPLPVVHLPKSGLPVPANAEIVIEGEIPPFHEENAHEGPFGEWPGYYTHHGYEPVVRIKSIYHRNNPIILGMPPLRPLGNCHHVGVSSIAPQIWEHLERGGVTDIMGVWGFSTQLLIAVSIRQRYAGHAQQALMTMAGFRQGDMKAYYVAVDDDIDPSNLEEVVWAMSTRADPATSIDILRGGFTGGTDPRLSPQQRANGDFTMGRVLINACKPFHWRDKFSKPNVFSPEERCTVEERWHRLLNELSGRLPAQHGTKSWPLN